MFDTTTPPKRKPRLVELAEQDLANARDNLHRARSAARQRDPEAMWGQSGQTLGSIVRGYEDWEREALETLARAKALEGAK